jgi:signal transduction histidine kinase
MDLAYDLRTRTTLVCGALALAIAVSVLLRGKVRKVHLLFAAFAADVGLWYLSQTLFGLFAEVPLFERLRIVLAVLVPVFVANLFEAMVPDESNKRRMSKSGRWTLLLAVPMIVIALTQALASTWARIAIFLYAVAGVAAALFELGQRGKSSRSRATQRRVRFVVITGALAGLFSLADFAWVIGYEPAYYPPPVGVVLSVVFLFMLAQALRHERLLDLYEMLGRTLVATALAFLIAFVFYVMVTVVGQFNTMWLNAIVIAIVVLVLFNPLRDWVEQRIQGFVFRDRRRLEASLSWARRRLAHILEVEELGNVVMSALERSRSVTSGALYLAIEDGTVFERLASIGDKVPARIEVATAHPLLEQLDHGPVLMEQVRRDAREHREPVPGRLNPETVLAAAEVLGTLRDSAVVLAIRSEHGEMVGLVVVNDERIGDAFSPEDVALLEALCTQIGVVVENSQIYAKMKERDRLAVLGQMAAGLAHEIRNPLGAIKGAAQLLAEPGPEGKAPDDASKEFIGIILEEVERLNAVVGSVLDLARQSDDTLPPIDVNGELRRTLQVLGVEWADHTTLTVDTELEPELPRAAIAPDQLRQVMMNLLQNAAQALSGRGRIRVRSRSIRRGEDRWVDISVRDDGPGIAPAQLSSIFLPFYTTKDEGTGLGLAICQRIVQDAGGRIDVRSRENEGTTFHVVLPAASDVLGTPNPGASRSVPPPPSVASVDEGSLDEGSSDEDSSDEGQRRGGAVDRGRREGTVEA